MYPVIYPRLPVADLDRATSFYLGLGFSLNERLSTAEISAMNVSDSIVLILVPEPFGAEVRSALGFPTRAEVDDMLYACVAGGGAVTSRARERAGGVYSGTAADLDGHLWEFLCRQPPPDLFGDS